MFKVSKRGKYINSEYTNYVPPNNVIDIHNWGSMYHTNREDFLTYRDKICELEDLIKNELKIRELNHSEFKIIRFNLSFIESLSSGLDTRSSWTNQKVSEVLVSRFDRKYSEAKEFCENHISELKLNPVREGKNWRDNEKYDRLNSMFELDMESLDGYFSSTFSSGMDELIKKSQELLDKLIEDRKENNGK